MFFTLNIFSQFLPVFPRIWFATSIQVTRIGVEGSIKVSTREEHERVSREGERQEKEREWTSVKRHEPSSIRKHCGCCGTLPSVCPSCRPAVRSTDSRSNNRQGRNTPPPPCRRLIVASSAPPAVSLSSPAPFSSRSDRTDSSRPSRRSSLLLYHWKSFGTLSFI